MTNNIKQNAIGVKTAEDVRGLMLLVGRRYTKAKAQSIIEGALGFDDFTGKLRRSVELNPAELVAAYKKLQFALAPQASQAVPASKVVPLRATAESARDVAEDALVFQDLNGSGNDELMPLEVIYQIDQAPARSVNDVCQRWIWCTTMKRYIRRSDPTVKLDTMAFDSEFNFLTRRDSLHKELTHTRLMQKFMFSEFTPGAPEFNGQRYNVWRPSAIVPTKGDTSLWDAHVEWLIPDEADRKKLLDWLAWVIQNPSKQPLYGCLLVGEQVGTGKSFIARVMEQIIGKVNTQRPKNSSLKGDFNPWIAMCRFCLIEELNQIGKREVAHELRDLITEPTVEVNPKGINPYTIENHAAIMAISNHPDALPVDQGDRRWMIIVSPRTLADKIAAVEDGHFKRLMPIVEPGNPDTAAIAAIAYELLQRDVSSFRQGDAPMTAGKSEMIELSRTPLETWLHENMRNDPFTRTIVNMRDDVVATVPDSVRLDKATVRLEANVRKFCQRYLGAVSVGDCRVATSKGSTTTRVVKLWAMNGRTFDDLDDIAAAYEAERDGHVRAADRAAVDDFGEPA
jgi:hypothetical protein